MKAKEPLYQEPGQKPGLARLSGLYAGLARKVWPGKAWQARPRPGFCGHHGHNSLAFPAVKLLCQAFLAFLAWKTWPQKPGHHGHVVQGQGVLAKLMLFLSISPYQNKTMGMIWQRLGHIWPIYGNSEICNYGNYMGRKCNATHCMGKLWEINTHRYSIAVRHKTPYL